MSKIEFITSSLRNDYLPHHEKHKRYSEIHSNLNLLIELLKQPGSTLVLKTVDGIEYDLSKIAPDGNDLEHIEIKDKVLDYLIGCSIYVEDLWPFIRG
jgi:hypothetical protein